MNESVQKWIEALRSGEYDQTRGALKRHKDKEDRYCCLGVACELYQQETGQGHWTSGETPFFRAGDSLGAGVLPRPVQEWLGLATPKGEYEYDKALSALNDRGYSFDAIACVIENRIHDLETYTNHEEEIP